MYLCLDDNSRINQYNKTVTLSTWASNGKLQIRTAYAFSAGSSEQFLTTIFVANVTLGDTTSENYISSKATVV